MREFALIIAIEDYNEVENGLVAKKLDGTLEAAQNFEKCLRRKWKRENIDGEVFFCSEPKISGWGASLKELMNCVTKIEEAARNKDGTLYVYFSGHGFRVSTENMQTADVLAASDFSTFETSGATCFKVDSLIYALRVKLGAGNHFYFIDACRNVVNKPVQPANFLGEGKAQGDPYIYLVPSTPPGNVSLVNNHFGQKLCDGIDGAGKAKVWERYDETAEMSVKFQPLCDFLEDELKQTIVPLIQGPLETAILARLKPPPEVNLTVNNRLEITGHISLEAARICKKNIVVPPGKTIVKILVPEVYRVDCDFGVQDVYSTPPRADLFSDAEIELMPSNPPVPSPGTGGTPPPTGEPLIRAVGYSENCIIDVDLPPDTSLVLENIVKKTKAKIERSDKFSFMPGKYLASYSSRKHGILHRTPLEIVANAPTRIAPAEWTHSLPHESIAKRMPIENGVPDFSEALFKSLTDPDLSIWLAIIGAGRILSEKTGDYSKIGPLPLHDFSQTRRDESPVYILAGLPRENSGLKITVRREGFVPSNEYVARSVDGMPGIFEAVFHPAAGQLFISFAIDDQPEYTITSFAIPNRCSLITLTLDEYGAPRFCQFLLPIGQLFKYLDPEIQRSMEIRYQFWDPDHPNALKDVLKLAQFSRAFCHRLNIGQEFGEHDLTELLHGKWLDPIGASLAAYECLRRKQTQYLGEVSRNMQRFFPDFPDSNALARLAGTSKKPMTGVPLFLDGLRAFDDASERLPSPVSLLDFTGLWTAWRGTAAAVAVAPEPAKPGPAIRRRVMAKAPEIKKAPPPRDRGRSAY